MLGVNVWSCIVFYTRQKIFYCFLLEESKGRQHQRLQPCNRITIKLHTYLMCQILLTHPWGWMELLLFHLLCAETPAALKGLHSSSERPTCESTWTSLKAALNFLSVMSHLDSWGIVIPQVNRAKLGTLYTLVSNQNSTFFTLCTIPDSCVG